MPSHSFTIASIWWSPLFHDIAWLCLFNICLIIFPITIDEVKFIIFYVEIQVIDIIIGTPRAYNFKDFLGQLILRRLAHLHKRFLWLEMGSHAWQIATQHVDYILFQTV